jgi:hypothetical protein
MVPRFQLFSHLAEHIGLRIVFALAGARARTRARGGVIALRTRALEVCKALGAVRASIGGARACVRAREHWWVGASVARARAPPRAGSDRVPWRMRAMHARARAATWG